MSAMREFHWPAFLPEFDAEAARRGFTGESLADFAAGPLRAYELPGDGPRIYLSGGIHGDEPAGPLALLELLRAGFFRPGVHWMICPAVNPDGLAAGARENAAGLDLNRDYLQRASAEVAAHAGWLDSRPAPDLFVSLHEDWETSGFYLYEINTGDDHPPRVRAILDAVRPWFPPEGVMEIDGHTARELGWIHHAAEPDLPEGWPEAIYLAKRGCPLSFTLETPSRAPVADRVAAHVAAARTVCGEWLDG